MEGVCMCIHPWNCRSHTALWIPEYRCWTQKESLLWLSEEHNRTGLLTPIQRVQGIHLFLAQQSLNFPGGFRRFYISLTMFGVKSLVQASILLSGWLRSCCPHSCLPLCLPLMACSDLKYNTVQWQNVEQWWFIRSCGFMLCSSNAFSSQSWWVTKKMVIMLKNAPYKDAISFWVIWKYLIARENNCLQWWSCQNFINENFWALIQPEKHPLH